MLFIFLFTSQALKHFFKGLNSLSKLGIVCIWFLINPVCIAAIDNNEELMLKAGISAISFPDVSAADIEVTLKLLVEEIAKNAGFDAQLTAYTDEREMQRDFESGKINFVVSSSLIMARDFDNTLFGSGIRFVRESEFPDQMLMVGNSGYKDLNELRGKRIVLAQNDPITELYADYLALKNYKKNYQSSFKVMPAVKVNQLLLQVFFRDADVTVVYYQLFKTALEMNPQLEGKLKIFAQLDNIPPAGAFFHKDVPVAFQDKIIYETIHLADRPRGKQLMDIFKSDRIYRSDASDLIPAKKLYEARQQLLLNQ